MFYGLQVGCERSGYSINCKKCKQVKSLKTSATTHSYELQVILEIGIYRSTPFVNANLEICGENC